MDHSHNTARYLEAVRRDGWTPALKARFLAVLSETGNARLAARRCELSAQSAYVQRRRDAAFARGWAAALLLARDHGAQVLAERAIEGVEEQIYYRGELVGTRRRYDARLLLAHIARLDRLADDAAAGEDAARFDELLAVIAGEGVPEALAREPELLPATREAHADQAAEDAEKAAGEDLPAARGKGAQGARKAAIREAGDAAWSAAAARWDGWFDRACAAVDDLGDPPALPLQDPVNPSTSPPSSVAPSAMPGLTSGALCANGPARPAGSLADHPSETVGAPGLPALNFQPRRGNEIFTVLAPS